MSENQTSVVDVLPQESHSAIQALEAASIDIQVSTAKRYPRELSKVKSAMLTMATLDEETAASCFFTLPRGGKTIQGESVRLAEIALSCYGNIRAGARPIQTITIGDNPHVIIQGVCHDIEKNTYIAIEKRGRIFTKKAKDGARRPIDEDDINLAVNRCAAIAFRDAVFKIIPKALIRPVFLAAKAVAIGDVKSLAVKREKVIDRLKQMGVPLDRILAAVEAHTIEDVTLEKLETLIGLGTALKDGETTIEEAFPPLTPKSAGTNGVKSTNMTDGTAASAQTTNGAQPTGTTAATVPAAEKTPQITLVDFVTENGFSFSELIEWGVRENQFTVPPPASPADIPEEIAKRLLFAKKGILTGLQKGRQ